MAVGVTTTEKDHTSVRKITYAWTTPSSGTTSGASVAAYDGKIIGLTTIPDGTAVPATNYDVTLTDADGHDVLLGAGANRSPTATEHVAEASLAGVALSALTLQVAAAGASAEGVVVVYIR